MHSIPDISNLLFQEFDLLSRYFSSTQVYIFGSQTEHFNPNSDLDLIIVSKSFQGISSLKRIEFVKKLLSNIYFRIDPICLTPVELERLKKSHSQFAQTILEKLTMIFPKGCQDE